MIYPWHSAALARFGVKVISPPTGEQITLAEAKLHLRVDDDGGSPPSHPDDSLITDLIAVAREYCEVYSGRSLAPQTLELAADAFPRSGSISCAPCNVGWSNIEYWALPLSMGPVSAVQSVTTTTDGVTTAYADYVFASYAEPARLLPLAGGTWPTLTASAEAIKVRYVAGYDLPGDSPNPNPMPRVYKQAMLLVLAGLYENRENMTVVTSGSLEMIPQGAESLMNLAPGGLLRLGMA